MEDSARVPPRPFERRIGIMQGRLVPSATGELESSPGERWREEFWSAAALSLNHIELVADRRRDARNPLWSPEGRGEIVAVADSSGVEVASLCLNEVLACPIDETRTEFVKLLEPVLADLPLRIVVVPLLEASDLGSLDQTSAARSVLRLVDCLPDRGRLVLELGVSAVETLQFLDTVGSPRVGVCYDVGNATASGFQPAEELQILGSVVWHLHAKDKDASKENVRFGVGEVPFADVFEALSIQRFDGLVTMEACRGNDPFATAYEHRRYLLSLHPQQQVAYEGRER
jgi:sugar phosphate isomerase/epimerase